MTYFDDIAGSVQRRYPGTSDAAISAAIDATVSAYKRALQEVDTHLPRCLCPDCEWLTPWDYDRTWHGSDNGYVGHKCRCLRCRRANREAARRRREGN